MFYLVHTGATLWQRSFTLSHENISRDSSGGRSIIFVRELHNLLSVPSVLAFRTRFFLIFLVIILLTLDGVPVDSLFLHSRFTFY
jgi:hypothetical protein